MNQSAKLHFVWLSDESEASITVTLWVRFFFCFSFSFVLLLAVWLLLLIRWKHHFTRSIEKCVARVNGILCLCSKNPLTIPFHSILFALLHPFSMSLFVSGECEHIVSYRLNQCALTKSNFKWLIVIFAPRNFIINSWNYHIHKSNDITFFSSSSLF